MKRFAFLLALLFIPARLTAQAPNFTGTFSMAGQNGTVVLTLQPAGAGKYTGTMANGGLTWQLAGDVYEDALTGTVNTGQGTLAFEAYVSAAQLELILVEIGPDGIPLVDQGQQFTFTRTQANAGASAAANVPAPFLRQGQAATPADPFVGRFTNGELTLTLEGSGGSYAGQLAVGEEAYPVSARMNGDKAEGMMNAPAGQYGFILAVSADGVVMSNAGTDYALKRVVENQNASPPGFQQQPAQAGVGAQAGQQDNSPLAQQWRAQMAGKKVTYISSYSSNTLGGGGLSTKFVYHLCSNGQFAYSGSDVVSTNLPGVGVEGGGSAGSSSGTWRIITEGQLAGIELRFGNGQVSVYRLDMQNGQTFANGDRVYVTPGEICN